MDALRYFFGHLDHSVQFLANEQGHTLAGGLRDFSLSVASSRPVLVVLKHR